MTQAMLIDISKCTACRACQVACKSWNDLPGEVTVCAGCYDNPPDLSPDTWNRIAFYEVEREGGQVGWLFRPIRCLHCTEASCVQPERRPITASLWSSTPSGALAAATARRLVPLTCRAWDMVRKRGAHASAGSASTGWTMVRDQPVPKRAPLARSSLVTGVS